LRGGGGLTGLAKADTRPDPFVLEAAAVTTLVDEGILVEGGGVIDAGVEATGIETGIEPGIEPVVVEGSAYSL
jgi:hypothetical protein